MRFIDLNKKGRTMYHQVQAALSAASLEVVGDWFQPAIHLANILIALHRKGVVLFPEVAAFLSLNGEYEDSYEEGLAFCGFVKDYPHSSLYLDYVFMLEMMQEPKNKAKRLANLQALKEYCN